MDQMKRIDRRTTLKWISSAAISGPLMGKVATGAEGQKAVSGSGYGTDPDLTRVYQPGDLWPLTFSEAQREKVIVLCDIIMPEDEVSPGASSLGVHDFIDEWISSPYQDQKSDRNLILKGLAWLDEEAERRGIKNFVTLDADTQLAICQELAISARKDRKAFPGSFFRRMRDLVAGGYYTTPEGMRDIGYRGNVAMVEWNGPPLEVLEKLGLEAEA